MLRLSLLLQETSLIDMPPSTLQWHKEDVCNTVYQNLRKYCFDKAEDSDKVPNYSC